MVDDGGAVGGVDQHLWNTWPHEVTAAVCVRFEAGGGQTGVRKQKTRRSRIQRVHLLLYLFTRNVACITVAAWRLVSHWFVTASTHGGKIEAFETGCIPLCVFDQNVFHVLGQQGNWWHLIMSCQCVNRHLHPMPQIQRVIDQTH